MSIKKNKLNEAAKNTGDFLSNYLGSNISQKPIEQPSQTNTDKSLQEYSRCIVTLRGVGYRFEAN